MAKVGIMKDAVVHWGLAALTPPCKNDIIRQ